MPKLNKRTHLRDEQISDFFGSVVDEFKAPQGLKIVAVTHLLQDRPFYLNALNAQCAQLKVYAKPKSVDGETFDSLIEAGFDLEKGQRPITAMQIQKVLGEIAEDEKVLLMDIGGYFASTLAEIHAALGNQLVGVIEDTENGIQAYEEFGEPPVPVVSVARSPLKNTEDFLVGQAVLHSGEHLIRQMGHVLQGKEACVIGEPQLC